jgi:hypothetical protein
MHAKGRAIDMNTLPDRYRLGLAARGLLEVPDIAGVHLSCEQGSLWITLDNDPRDIVLEAGETFFGSGHRRALVYAFEPSTVGLRPSRREAAAAAPTISFAVSPAAG